MGNLGTHFVETLQYGWLQSKRLHKIIIENVALIGCKLNTEILAQVPLAVLRIKPSVLIFILKRGVSLESSSQCYECIFVDFALPPPSLFEFSRSA